MASPTHGSAAGVDLAPEGLPVPEDADALVPRLWARDVTRDDAGRLTVDGVAATELAATHGTPLYVLSEADFRARARRFKDAFDDAFASLCGSVDVYYAGKAFLCIEAARWVAAEGLRLDTCSGGELAVAARAGTPGKDLGLHGNNKSDAEIIRALDMGVGRIVADSLDELTRISRLASARSVTAPVLVRVTPGVHAHTHDFIATAHEDQKFGLSLTDEDSAPSPAEQAVELAASLDGVDLLGVHCHIGSQIFEPSGFELAAERVLAFVARMRRAHGVALPEMDLGGGYGIAYTESDEPRPPEQIAAAMAAVIGRTCAMLDIEVPRISVEPGRAISGPAGLTLYTVGTVKTVHVGLGQSSSASTAPRRYVSVDGGMSDNVRPALYDADYTSVLASRTSQAAPALSRVVGMHCESGDIVVKDVFLPADVAAGDLLAVPATGAYCWALASNYNYVPRPAVVAVADGESRTIIRGETEDDLLARDLGA